MDIPSIFFYFFASILILASLGVVMARNPMYNVLSLVVVIFCISSLFMLLEAYFVGVILLLVYAGAVLVFFLFVVMCLNLNLQTLGPKEQGHFQLLGGLMGLLVLTGAYLSIKSFLEVQTMPAESIRGTIENIGQILFTEYLLPFELTSLLLLIAIFGIVSLAQGALNRGQEAGA